ncbi:hypothetical protein CGLO_05847 [Colletotrichum gloeosporioides Cg-14]|uniref:Uncharacterized protein n=1 Tax=Colletotrichum gloeosporioides (strain Cg-14) TaxID=1237896 RepID=T0KP56_COLGC|nr:hypothetical protein CGLO_05847 [Colletotrichum gloeosporioides Cg-14]
MAAVECRSSTGAVIRLDARLWKRVSVDYVTGVGEVGLCCPSEDKFRDRRPQGRAQHTQWRTLPCAIERCAVSMTRPDYFLEGQQQPTHHAGQGPSSSHHLSEPVSLDLTVARTRCAYQLCSLCRGRLLESCSASAQIAASRRNQLNIADSAPRGKADSQPKHQNIYYRGVAAQQQQEIVLLVFYNLLLKL